MIKLMDILVNELPEILDEAKYIYIVRGRKKMKRLAPKPGYKIVNGKYKKMTIKERRRRSRGQRGAVKRRRAKKEQINRKRNLSIRKRISLGLTRR